MKKLLVTLLILFFGICSTNQAYAYYNWRHGAGENTILGTENASDIDLASYSDITEPLDLLLSNYRRGCQIKYASASTLTVESGEIVVSNAGGTIRLMQKNTSDTTVSWANIDAGAEAASTTYYLWAYQDTVTTSTFSVCISTSSTAPSGKTYYKRLGSFYNDASSNITLITNDESEELAIYDSGWFAAADTTKSHNLGTTKVMTQFYGATDSSGTDMGIIQIESADNGYYVYDITSTQVSVAGLGNESNRYITSDGTAKATATYFRIIMIALE